MSVAIEQISSSSAPPSLDPHPATPSLHPGSEPVAKIDSRHFDLFEVPVEISAPLAGETVVAGEPYVLKDTSGRVLCMNLTGRVDWEWAFVGQYASYPGNVLPISFSANPFTTNATVYADQGKSKWKLYANGSATSWEWLFWGDSGWQKPVLSVKASGTLQSFKLRHSNGGVEMGVCADAGTWHWAYVGGSSYTPLDLSLHKFFVSRAKLVAALKKAWPKASFSYLRTNDTEYEVIDNAKAVQIWNSSKLTNYTWKKDVFDCDDFSYVYKAEASRRAYDDNAVRSYAIGCVAATTSNGAHAANLFVNYSGQVRILEPQTGHVIDPETWTDKKGVKYEPYEVLL